MGKVVGFCGVILLVLMSGNNAPAAVGKCTVIDVDGNRLVLYCPVVSKGFAKGSKIKIKSDNDEVGAGR
ncbi:MAG: hypothetical protein KJ630_12185 [Proteobacteria bacterium]|nr:hypothetical protein [Pseudomonadota bacterium]